MDIINKESDVYTSVVDDSDTEGIDVLFKELVEKINEIVDWINTQ